jgi:lysophospholipase L1-like esterase
VIRTLELEDGATLTPVKKSCRMIMYGDSITHGYDTFVSAHSYASLLADALDADARNKGIGAEKFFPALAEISDDCDPAYVTVAYGTNDWSGKTLEEFENNSAAFYRTLSKKYPNAKIFALAPIWRGDMDRVTKVGSFYHVAEHLGAVAAELPNVTLINCFDFVPKSPEYFSDKHLHPNDAGFRYYFDGLLAEIKKYL